MSGAAAHHARRSESTFARGLIPGMFAVFSRGELDLEPLRALLFGLTIAAPVGPIALLLVHIGLNHRLRAALLAALGVAAADLTYAVVALTAGAALATALSAHRLALQGFSSLLLLALGIWLAQKALRASPQTGPLEERAPGMARLYLLTLGNPLTIVLFVGFAGSCTPPVLPRSQSIRPCCSQAALRSRPLTRGSAQRCSAGWTTRAPSASST